MKEKFTPGPWKVRYLQPENPDSDFFVEAKNNNRPDLGYGIEILQDDFGDHNGYPTSQREADARLIAAAPDMYKFIKGIAEGYHPDPAYAQSLLNSINP